MKGDTAEAVYGPFHPLAGPVLNKCRIVRVYSPGELSHIDALTVFAYPDNEMTLIVLFYCADNLKE